MDIIGPLSGPARGLLERGETLQAFSFIGSLSTDQFVPVMIQSGSESIKDQSAQLILSAPLVLEADFVFTIMDAWSLRSDKLWQMEAILDKYGSIGASPYAIDVCTLALETRRGVWVAQPRINPRGMSTKKWTIETVEFR